MPIDDLAYMSLSTVSTTDDLGSEVADISTRAAHCHKFKEKRARTNLNYSMVHRTILAVASPGFYVRGTGLAS